MSSQDPNERELHDEGVARNESDDDPVANKLSKELSNWRRRRGNGRPRRHEGASANYQSEAARTIKVRGHETLVVRKPKAAQKPSAVTDDSTR